MDILEIIGRDTELRWVASTDGGEWAGPCPFCGGSDRFHVWPHHSSGKGRWWCRGCGASGDAADYVQKRDGCGYREAKERLGQPLTGRAPAGKAGRAPELRPVTPAPRPGQAWQERGRFHVEACERALWHSRAGTEGLRHLLGRGLCEATIRHFRLGFCPEQKFDDPGAWGLDGNKIFIGQGVTVPHLEDGNLWGIKVRLLPPTVWEGVERRYSSPRGCKAVLFGLDGLQGGGLPLLLCEGELDMILAWQEIGGGGPGLADVATFAGAGRGVPLSWLSRILSYSRILVAYDTDGPGRAGAAKICEALPRAEDATVPIGGDLTGFHQAGGDLAGWLAPILANAYPLTLLFPAAVRAGFPAGQWRRLESGEVEVVFNTPAELAATVATAG